MLPILADSRILCLRLRPGRKRETPAQGPSRGRSGENANRSPSKSRAVRGRTRLPADAVPDDSALLAVERPSGQQIANGSRTEYDGLTPTLGGNFVRLDRYPDRDRPAIWPATRPSTRSTSCCSSWRTGRRHHQQPARRVHGTARHAGAGLSAIWPKSPSTGVVWQYVTAVLHRAGRDVAEFEPGERIGVARRALLRQDDATNVALESLPTFSLELDESERSPGDVAAASQVRRAQPTVDAIPDALVSADRADRAARSARRASVFRRLGAETIDEVRALTENERPNTAPSPRSSSAAVAHGRLCTWPKRRTTTACGPSCCVPIGGSIVAWSAGR